MGGRLFHGTRAERCLPAAQREELATVLSFVFLYFWVAGGGEWSLERLRAPAIGIRRVAEPGLSTAIARRPRKLRLCRSPPGRPPAAGVQRGKPHLLLAE
jgi:hypothetical protein